MKHRWDGEIWRCPYPGCDAFIHANQFQSIEAAVFARQQHWQKHVRLPRLPTLGRKVDQEALGGVQARNIGKIYGRKIL